MNYSNRPLQASRRVQTTQTLLSTAMASRLASRMAGGRFRTTFPVPWGAMRLTIPRILSAQSSGCSGASAWIMAPIRTSVGVGSGKPSICTPNLNYGQHGDVPARGESRTSFTVVVNGAAGSRHTAEPKYPGAPKAIIIVVGAILAWVVVIYIAFFRASVLEAVAR